MLPVFAHAFALAATLTAGLWGSGDSAPPAELPIDREVPALAKQAVTAEQGMVASAHHLASEAGAAILAAGGNFADAAIAVQAVLAVVEPESSGPGGGCFILFHDTETDSLYAIDGREESATWNYPGMFMDEDGSVLPDVMTGGRPVGTPGTISAMSRLHWDFGSLPLADCLAPAIELAESGFPVPPDMARAIRSEERRLKRFEASAALYFHPDGSPYAEGEIFKNPELAGLFRMWIEEPIAQFFYRGEVGHAIAAAAGSNKFRKGRLRISDIANYRAIYRDPLVGSYRGRGIATFPPPTSGGVTLLEILGLLESREPLSGDLRGDDALLVEHLDRLARASRVAFADRDRWLGDPDWRPHIPMRDLCSESYVAGRVDAAFGPEVDLTVAAQPGELESHTTHFSIVDANGSMLACTSTIETTFGCAQVVPGYGFPLNNELTDFNWIPSDPPGINDAEGGRMPRIGDLRHPIAQGGKRPRSSMCPIIVYDDAGKPALAMGSPGGSRIIGTVASALLCLLDYDFGLQEALDFPRLHCRNRPVEIETFGWNRDAVAAAMGERGWEIAPLERYPLLQGDVNAVRVLPGGRREGASDPRHDGMPAGY